MEEQKALKNIIHCLKMGVDLAVCEDCDLYPCDHTVVEDMARVAIKAIKKHIPKVVVCEGNDESDWVHCSCCNEIIGVNESVYDSFCDNNWNPIYCHKCGQSLIWE